MLYHGVPASLANSSGIFLGDTAHFDLARPGAALYGINPTPGATNPMRNVVELTGRILQVRKVAQGETVGYGAAWTARRASRIAVVALGYADGLVARRQRRRPQGRRYGHRRRRNAARSSAMISMDLACVDVTDLADSAVRRGDMRDLHRRGHSDRRGRRICRHHRLRNSCPARPALPSRLSWRLRAVSRWSRAHRTSSARAAAPPRRAGPAAATPAAPGTRWSRKARSRRHAPSRKGRLFVIEPLKGQTLEAPRLASGIAEFDRVTGGGLVRGSVLLLGGDPGIGKSTLLIEVAAAYARHGHRAVYISGEEAVAQVRLRAERLGLDRRGGRTRRRNLGRRYRRDALARKAAAASGHRFDPDHVDANGRSPRPARSRKCAGRRASSFALPSAPAPP